VEGEDGLVVAAVVAVPTCRGREGLLQRVPVSRFRLVSGSWGLDQVGEVSVADCLAQLRHGAVGVVAGAVDVERASYGFALAGMPFGLMASG
jgi:hypothetical protein